MRVNQADDRVTAQLASFSLTSLPLHLTVSSLQLAFGARGKVQPLVTLTRAQLTIDEPHQPPAAVLRQICIDEGYKVGEEEAGAESTPRKGSKREAGPQREVSPSRLARGGHPYHLSDDMADSVGV